MNDPLFQTVVLDDPRTAALYVENTEPDGDRVLVFYDLNRLTEQYALYMIQAQETLPDTPKNAARLEGVRFILGQILDSAENLAAEYSMSKVTTIADMFEEQ